MKKEKRNRSFFIKENKSKGIFFSKFNERGVHKYCTTKNAVWPPKCHLMLLSLRWPSPFRHNTAKATFSDPRTFCIAFSEFMKKVKENNIISLFENKISSFLFGLKLTMAIAQSYWLHKFVLKLRSIMT